MGISSLKNRYLVDITSVQLTAENWLQEHKPILAAVFDLSSVIDQLLGVVFGLTTRKSLIDHDACGTFGFGFSSEQSRIFIELLVSSLEELALLACGERPVYDQFSYRLFGNVLIIYENY